MQLEEARAASVEEKRADLIRSAARGQGPTFIAAKLDYLIESVREEGATRALLQAAEREVERLTTEREEPLRETEAPPKAWCEKCADWVTWTGHKCFQPSRFGL